MPALATGVLAGEGRQCVQHAAAWSSERSQPDPLRTARHLVVEQLTAEQRRIEKKVRTRASQTPHGGGAEVDQRDRAFMWRRGGVDDDAAVDCRSADRRRGGSR